MLAIGSNLLSSPYYTSSPARFAMTPTLVYLPSSIRKLCPSSLRQWCARKALLMSLVLRPSEHQVQRATLALLNRRRFRMSEDGYCILCVLRWHKRRRATKEAGTGSKARRNMVQGGSSHLVLKSAREWRPRLREVHEMKSSVISLGLSAYVHGLNSYRVIEQVPYNDGTRRQRDLCSITFNVALSQANEGNFRGADLPAFVYLACQALPEDLHIHVHLVGLRSSDLRQGVLLGGGCVTKGDLARRIAMEVTAILDTIKRSSQIQYEGRDVS
ncbi:hypothetical protein BD310DRAFT_987613 [Dichomitus squalens]|uniref:Uncharacterized protein n=1 Tax=Dichomitus squalens TaxID=114155 RepID=A0A4Q9PK66_9APHY|nr:hypothetical protein BD310DRAFT_987613 [Dichomitus squalens]